MYLTTQPGFPFTGFPKMARLSRDIIITEKIDGTNASIFITDDLDIYAGSRTRWINPHSDNYGFAAWVDQNASELIKLGPGQHFGEWWGSGIQRGYGLTKGERRFSLFNVSRWGEDGTDVENKPDIVHVVPLLYKGPFSTEAVELYIDVLGIDGSAAAPGYMNPEGIVVWHTAANIGFKKTIKNDEKPKSLV